jgi:MFS family permease
MAVTGVGVAGTTLVPGQTLISHWFNRLRGRAMGLMMLGIGVGGLVMPPLTAFLIQRIGWRGAFGFFCAAFWLVVVPLVLIFIRSKPSDLGLLSDGASAEAGSSNPATAAITGLPVKRAVMSAAFALIFSTYVLQLYGQSGLNLHFAPLLDRHTGFSPQQAANFFGLTLGFSVVGRPLFGWLSDRWSPRGLMALAGLVFAAGTVVLEICFIRLEMSSPVPIYVFGVLYGSAVGGSATVLPILIGRCFGLLNFSRILGLVMRGFAVGVVLGPLFAGKVFDTTGSYEIALFTWLAAFILSAVLVLMVREPPLQREFEQAE